MIDLQGIKDD